LLCSTAHICGSQATIAAGATCRAIHAAAAARAAAAAAIAVLLGDCPSFAAPFPAVVPRASATVTAPPQNSTAATMSALVTRQRMVVGQNRRRAARGRMVLAGTVPNGGGGVAVGSVWAIAGGGDERRGSSAGGPPAASLPSWRARATAFARTAKSWSDRITLSCAAMPLDPGRRGGRTRDGRPSAPVPGECAPVMSGVPGSPGAPGPGRARMPPFPGCSSCQLCVRTRQPPTGSPDNAVMWTFDP
jgi:hypothetical protein